ncbi:hypothetical protein PYW07_012860 [Mythimna separata]|uniref:Uncharacterized protein n=1 Tax=Mythimna separata TaxID=271217 RepID=A0AAD7Y903_MYTSE|nr:hypothetical protein PYW07_012860 [Mythimna separata]
MLVLLISLFSNYGLYQCSYRTGQADSSESPLGERIHKSVHEIDSLLKDFQLEIRKEKSLLRTVDQEVKDIGVLDYSITSVWWGESTLRPKVTTTSTFFPTPEGHFPTTTKDPWEKFALPGIQPNYSTTDALEVYPHHGHVPDASYDLDQTPDNPYLTYSHPKTVLPRYDPKFVPPTRPSYPVFRSTKLSSTIPEHFFNYIDKKSTYPAESPIHQVPRKSSSPVRGPVTARPFLRGVSMSELYKKVMRDRTAYKPYEKRLKNANRLTTLPRPPQQRGRTLSKAQRWVQNREWLKSKKPGDTLLGHIRQGAGDQVDKPPVDEPSVDKPPVDKPPVEEKPANVENPPVENKPAEVENKPAEIENNPAENQNQPANNENQLAENQNQPAGNQNQLAENQNQPAENQNQLAENQNQLANNENQPAENQNQPAENQNLPAEVENKPAETENQPAVDENAPINKPPDNAENPPVEQTTGASDELTFSMPELTDIISSLNVPGLDEVDLTKGAALTPTYQTVPNPLTVGNTLTQAAFTTELFHEDAQGFLYVQSPGTIYVPPTTKSVGTFAQILLHAENFTMSTVGRITDRYHDLMEKSHEGYLVTYFSELTRVIAQKKSADVAAVLGHAESIYNELYEKGSLTFLGEEVLALGTKVSRMCSGNDITVLQSQTNMMNQMLVGRAQFVSVEVNSALDYADLMVEDHEGEDLYESLRAFENFPASGLSGHAVCKELITTFFQPFRRLKNTERLRKLTDSITAIVAKKFGRRRSGAGGALEELHQPKKKIKHQLPLKPRLQKRRYQKFHLQAQRGNRQNHRRQVYTTQAMVRSLLPIRSLQRRFHVITPRQLRSNGYLNLVRPTLEYFKRRVGRPVHPPNGMLQLFPQGQKVEYVRRAQMDGEENHPPAESPNQQQLGTMRDKLRRIVLESSYSDEEASLKRNLRQALRVHGHTSTTSRTHTISTV